MSTVIEMFLSTLLESLAVTIEKISYILKINPIVGGADCTFADGTKFSDPFFGFGDPIRKTLRNIAISICALLFCIEFIKRLMKMGKFEMEDIMIVAYKFVLARAALDIGNQLLGAMTSTAVSIISNIVDKNNGGFNLDITGENGYGQNVIALIKALKKAGETLGITESIGIVATLLIPLLAIKIIGMVGICLAYGRLFELYMYHIIYPIPCGALLFDQGRVTKKFLTSYFACALSGAFMMLSIYLFKFMTENELSIITKKIESDGIQSLGSTSFTLLLASLIMLIGMTKSSSWARRMLGEE